MQLEQWEPNQPSPESLDEQIERLEIDKLRPETLFPVMRCARHPAAVVFARPSR